MDDEETEILLWCLVGIFGKIIIHTLFITQLAMFQPLGYILILIALVSYSPIYREGANLLPKLSESIRIET